MKSRKYKVYIKYGNIIFFLISFYIRYKYINQKEEEN